MVLALLLATTGCALADPVAEAGDEIWDYTGRPVVFEGVGVADPTLPIILYEWDFDGDGTVDWNSTRTGSATNTFLEPGEFNATFRITQYNASSREVLTASDSVHLEIVSGRPVGRVTSDSTAQVDTAFDLVSEYYDPDGGQLTYVWRVNGELTSDQAQFRHRFSALGNQNITLRVIDDEGEFVYSQFTLVVVEDIAEERDLGVYYVMILVLALLVVVAVIALRSIQKGHREPRPGRELLTYDEVARESAAIVQEATLADRVQEPTPRSKARVVRPERVPLPPEKAMAKEAKVPAAPARLPCPECGTTMSEEGVCPFCEANEAIDAVERTVRDLQEDGYIIAEVEDRLDSAKAELHVKNFDGVKKNLDAANDLMEEAVREHERCLSLMALVDDLVNEAQDRDVDTSKAANLLKLAQSFMKSGKYPKAIHYAERSRDFLVDKLQPFDLDRYFCEHCRNEVAIDAEECPHCDRDIESGLIKRARRELITLKERFEALSKDHKRRDTIAAQLEKAQGHVDGRTAAAANEHINRARELLDAVDAGLDLAELEVEEGGEEAAEGVTEVAPEGPGGDVDDRDDEEPPSESPSEDEEPPSESPMEDGEPPSESPLDDGETPERTAGDGEHLPEESTQADDGGLPEPVDDESPEDGEDPGDGDKGA